MMPGNKIYSGILKYENNTAFLQSAGGERFLEQAAIWNGYIRHWVGRELCGTILAETDYISGRPVALLWPRREPESGPFMELYYNERLVRYGISFMGHSAINVNGSIFNFSHLVNECEIMSEPEYFYRPALGRFSPAPGGGFNIDDPEHPHLDKFGREFMRTIHVLRVTGIETGRLLPSLQGALELIRNTPQDTALPGMYRDFNILTNSCTTIIRDSLRQSGYRQISGVFPRELFISAAWSFTKRAEQDNLIVSVITRRQLIVDEAPASRKTPVINPLNVYRRLRLRMRGVRV